MLLAAILMLLTPPVLAAAPPAKGSPEAQALKAMETALQGTPFSNPRLSPDSQLVVDIGENYEMKRIPFSNRDRWIEDLCGAWTSALRQSASSKEPAMGVLGPSGGTLYSCEEGGSSRIRSWSDLEKPFTGPDPIGNFFMAVAFSRTFAPVASTGFNLTEGFSFYKSVYDAAISEAYGTANNTIILGLLGRARPRFNQDFGMTFGLQPSLVIAAPAGSTGLNTNFSLGGQVGVNFYVPSGSVDLTALVQTNGSYVMSAGYTFFLNLLEARR
jgi:hypothetical protein